MNRWLLAGYTVVTAARVSVVDFGASPGASPRANAAALTEALLSTPPGTIVEVPAGQSFDAHGMTVDGVVNKTLEINGVWRAVYDPKEWPRQHRSDKDYVDFVGCQ